jgi:CBS domain-containing protein
MSNRIHPAARTATAAGAALGGAAALARAVQRRRRPRLVTAQVMSTPAVTIDADATAAEAAAVLASSAVGALPVCDGDRRPVGIVTDRDLVVRLLGQDENGDQPALRDVAETPPVVADANEPITAAADRMRRLGVRRLPVVAHGRVTGVVSRGDLIRHLPPRAARALHRLSPGEASADARSARWLFRHAYA